MSTIGSLFANDIHRTIEEVIKVDQTDEDVVKEEIAEYVVTDAILRQFTEVIEGYRSLWQKPGDRMAVWVSGFFGSGKSSFAKMLGLALGNRRFSGPGEPSAAARFLQRIDDGPLKVLLPTLNEQVPTHAVIFDVSTDRGIRSGNQTLTEIMYRQLLQSLGYATDLDLAELEIALEERGQLAAFVALYHDIFKKDWDREKGKVIFAMIEASRVLNALDPDTFTTKDSWVQSAKHKSDITPGRLAERAVELMKRRRPNENLIFVVDEVGQFVARDVQKMLDLQAIIQNFGVKSRGRHWVVVTSQEKLGEILSGLDGKSIELNRLMDRFPWQVHLEPSDISEVTSRRVLKKNAAAEAMLGKLFDDNRGRLTQHTRLTAEIKLPELTHQGFIDLYPLLPYQIDLIIQVVSGLRTQGGANKHVGGANRTIIKLAQQLLVHPSVNLAGQTLGQLARLDQVYDLIENNISADIRQKVASIGADIHPLARPVAKAICLLQFVKSVHRSAENIAAGLHDAVAADSRLPDVKDALDALVAHNKVRLGDDGYRIQTPAEDDWETARRQLAPTPGEAFRVQQEILTGFWQPKPTSLLHDTRTFSAGLMVHGREQVAGDLMFDVRITDAPGQLDNLAIELRTLSQQELKTVFWAIASNPEIDREIVELYRSRQMVLSRSARAALTGPESALLGEERVRERRHLDLLKRHLKVSVLAGRISSRGHDRSPPEGSDDIVKAAKRVLDQELPIAFERFKEAAAKGPDLKKGSDALFVADNLNGLPSVFETLGLWREEKGKRVFATESGPLKEVLGRITNSAAYGDSQNGKSLTEDLAREPYGWDFEAVRLFVMALIRAGKVEATSKGRTIDNLQSADAKDALGNNNLFRATAFRPKEADDFTALAAASEAFVDTFGVDVKELTTAGIALDLRREVGKCEDPLVEQLTALQTFPGGALPGAALLSKAQETVKAIQRGSDRDAIASFRAAHKSLKDGVKRASELGKALTVPVLDDLGAARKVLGAPWEFLSQEHDLPPEIAQRAPQLQDLLQRETFFRELTAIRGHTEALRAEYAKRYQAAVDARTAQYSAALDKLRGDSRWADLNDEQRRQLAQPLVACATVPVGSVSIPLLRADVDACKGRLGTALKKLGDIVEGERLVSIDVGTYFGTGIETEAQLDEALQDLRAELAALIRQGKKVVVH